MLIAAGRTALGTTGKAGFTHIHALTALSGTAVAGARQAVTWQAMGTPGVGQTGNNGALSIPIGAGETPIALALFDALTVGNQLSLDPLGSTVRGVGTIDAATDLVLSKGHGLTTDDRVFFSTVMGEAIPTGISTTTLYFVLSAGLTADAFAFSTTSGGGALNVTVSGEVQFYKTVPNTFASAGNLTIATNAFILDLNGL
jgi:hypothetical protein